MKTIKDLARIDKCRRLLKIKSIDYEIESFPDKFFDELMNKAKLYGKHLDEVDVYIRDTMYACLKAKNCSIKDETAVTALSIIKRNVQECIELTELPPKAVTKMDAKELFNIVKEFEEEPDNIKVAAYALGQYQITESTSKSADEDNEAETADEEDWFDDEEEEDDENEYIK